MILGISTLTINGNEKLNKEIKDLICKRLNNDWKDFCRRVLPDHEVEMIDRDNDTIYEKSYAVFTKWERTSSDAINVAMVKTQLRALRRNDIILDVFKGMVVLHQVH